MFLVGVDLGKTKDYTAISIIERLVTEQGTLEYHLRYLHRPQLGTRYPAIVADVIRLLETKPLVDDPWTTLVVDKTGVGAAVVDIFTDAGVKPRAVTITGGDTPNITDPYNLRVPKRDLAGLMVALLQTRRFKVADGLELAPVLTAELLNFKVKINVATGNDSYEAWRESVHDDLVLSVALACWYGERCFQPPDILAMG